MVAEGPSTGSGRTERVRSAPAVWVGGGVRPPGAPLDTGFRRYDGGRCGKYESRRRPRAAPRPWVPAFARTTVGGAGPLAGFVSGCRTPPLWIPAFAGMTLGVVRERRWESAGRAGAAGGGGNPSTGSGRTESRSAPAMWVGGGVPPPGAPLDTGFRRYDDGGRGNDATRRRPRAAPLPWVPAKAGTTVGGVCGTRGSCWWRRALRQAQGERSLSACQGSCLLGNDCIVPGGPSTGSGRTETRIAPMVVVGARGVRGSEWIGLYDGAYAAVHVYGGACYEAGSF